mmetsp:Transcript_41776/g.110147  ORF Transcript_41776/g.110147 Transcript_41776/m.110147 type:complete len:83 (+) Transcript_41776:119-367(+)
MAIIQSSPKLAKKADDERAQQALTKKIAMRIEQTMASRAAPDGAGLSLVSTDGSAAKPQALKPSLGVGRSASKGSVLSKKAR